MENDWEFKNILYVNVNKNKIQIIYNLMIYSLLLSIAVSVSLCSKGLLLNHPEAPTSQFYNDETNTVHIPNLIKQYVGNQI